MSKKSLDFNECRKRRQYTNSEIASLFVDFYSGDMKAREKIIVGNLYIVTLVISKIIKDFSRADFEDLFSVGEIGLLKAVDSYDSSSNALFTTYAFTCIRNEIVYYLRSKYLFESLTLEDEYEFDYNHCTGIGKSSFLDFIVDKDDIQDSYDDRELLEKLYKAINKLDSKCKRAIILYFGFCGSEEHLIKEVAEIMGITYGQARHLIEKSIIKLRKILEEEGYSCSNITDIRQYCKKYF